MKFKRFFSIICYFALLTGCMTTSSLTSDQPPKISPTQDLTERIDAAIKFGQDTQKDVIATLAKNDEWNKAGPYLKKWIIRKADSAPSHELINAMGLYQRANGPDKVDVFEALQESSRPLCKQLSWHLAANFPSKELRLAIDETFTRAISQNTLKDLYWPKMADAVVQNQLTTSYTILRQALFETNNVAFAKAMATLSPNKASEDFMSYLGQAPIEELRQLNLTSVDILSCMEILAHLQKFPAPMSHPNFENLFFFSISRNTVLAEQAKKLIQVYLPEYNQHLALMLARQPNWIQIAFIEGAKRDLSPRLSTFLKMLKSTTAQKDVIDEINQVIR